MKINLDSVDDSVWEYTCTLTREPYLARLEIRCGSGRQEWLGRAATTRLGPIFISSWPTDPPLNIGYVVNGRVLPPAEAIRRDKAERQEHLVSQTGEPRSALKDGMFAAVAIPAGLPQAYAPFYVRCQKHGDAVIDRLAVIEALRTPGKPLKVSVSMPFHEYVPQRTDGLRVIKTSSVEVRRYGAVGGMTPEEFKHEWRARGGG